ncbi:MAG: hypothetical protein K6U14_07050 [Firmicutes bacterium]|nr:hypothetical protein [Alicyclobacillaceae bacterium]MCL6497375.1 hypothetical protein [Bacillota bacterium]
MPRPSPLIAEIRRFVGAGPDHPYASAENMRAFDHLLRSQAAAALARAAAVWRRRYTAALADPSAALAALAGKSGAVEAARAAKGWADRLSQLAQLLEVQPAPAGDRVWRRLRDTESLLDTLIALDYAVVGHLEAIGRATEQGAVVQLEAELARLEARLRERWQLLESVP